MFARWCQFKGIAPLPAPPAAVAAFIAECASLGPEKVWQAVQDIARAHAEHGYANPTLGHPAATAMNGISGIEPPRSWPKEERKRFLELPWDLQTYIIDREAQRDRAVRRAQNAAAAAARKGWINGEALTG